MSADRLKEQESHNERKGPTNRPVHHSTRIRLNCPATNSGVQMLFNGESGLRSRRLTWLNPCSATPVNKTPHETATIRVAACTLRPMHLHPLLRGCYWSIRTMDRLNFTDPIVLVFLPTELTCTRIFTCHVHSLSPASSFRKYLKRCVQFSRRRIYLCYWSNVWDRCIRISWKTRIL